MRTTPGEISLASAGWRSKSTQGKNRAGSCLHQTTTTDSGEHQLRSADDGHDNYIWKNKAHLG